MDIAGLVLGLGLFLGLHSVRIVADDWRSRQIARWGAGAWKGGYSLLSGLGLALIVWGYGRRAPCRWCCGLRRCGPAIWRRC
jgi:uncharacterized membrane protein